MVLLFRGLLSFLAYAKRRDVEISRETPKRARDWHWALAKFYPRSRRRIAPADKVIALIVVVAIYFAFWELLVLMNPILALINIAPFEANTNLFGWATAAFLCFFSLEFAIRFFLKGRQYMRPWGWIDLGVILIDGISTAFFLGLFGDWHGTGAVGLLRILRLLRLGRLAKLLRYVAEWRHIKRALRLTWPYIMALMSCAFLALVIIVFVLFIAFAFAGSNPMEKLAELLVQVVRALKPDETATGTTTIATIFVLAAIANMVAIFFMPIMARITAQQKRLEKTDLVESHVIFCLNDINTYKGAIEEFVHVFQKNAHRDVFILVDENAEYDVLSHADIESNVHVLSGDLALPKIWKQAAANRASAVLMLGRHKSLDVDDVVLLSHDSQLQRPGSLTIFEIDDNDELGYRRERNIGNDDVDIVRLSFKNLRDRIECYAWNRRSLQYAYLHRLADEYEEEIEFPDLDYVNGDATSAQILEGIFNADCHLKVDRRTHNLLIQSSEHSLDTADDPIQELRMLDKVRRVLADHPLEAKNACVFVYVESLELVDWNSRFAEITHANVSVIAVEITAAFALLHELEYPGALVGWFCELDENNLVQAPREHFGGRFAFHTAPDVRYASPERIGSLIDLDNGWVVLGQQANPTPIVVTKVSDRLELLQEGQILVGSQV